MLRCGIGRAVITPPLDTPNGIWMAQKHIRAEGLHQDLWVSAMVIENSDGSERLALLEFDLTHFSNMQASVVRHEVAQAVGIPEDRVLLSCTHNHAAPVHQDGYADEGADRVRMFIESIPAHAAGAARQAVRSLRDVRIAGGQGHCAIGVNRDLPLASGRIVTGPNPNGFADQEVRVLRLDTADGSPFACIVNYQCHPTVLGPENRLISPDYLGPMRRVVEERTGAFCMFLQGAAGNMGPIETFVGDVAVCNRLGTILGLEAAKVFTGIRTVPAHRELSSVVESGAPLTKYRWVDDPEPFTGLKLQSRHVQLPVRHPLTDLYEGVERRTKERQEELEHLERIGAPESDIVKARQRLTREGLRAQRAALYRSIDHLPAEMHAIRLGSVALLLMWGEPYSQIGAEVKRRSPFRHTLFGGYMGGDPSYIPTPDAYTDQPAFEVDNSPFAPEASGIAVEEALALLHEIAVS